MTKRADERERIERLFAAIESHPDPDEREAVVARLRAPATKLDIAHALVIQADFNTTVSSILLDLTGGREVKVEKMMHLAELQRRFGTEMIAVLETLAPDDSA